jgi:hypothetical protein
LRVYRQFRFKLTKGHTRFGLDCISGLGYPVRNIALVTLSIQFTYDYFIA